MNIRTPLRSVGVCTPLTRAESAEKAGEYIAQVKVKAAEAAKTAAALTCAVIRVNARMAKAVILGPLFAVGEDLVCLVGLFKLGFGFLVAGV